MDGRVNLAPRRRRFFWTPYVMAGLALHVLNDPRQGVFTTEAQGVQSVGAGFRVGGGLEMNLHRRFVLGFRSVYEGTLLGSPIVNPPLSCGDSYIHTVSVEATLSERLPFHTPRHRRH